MATTKKAANRRPAVAAGTPNLFQLQGDQTHVTYSTTSIDGKPQFTYQDAVQTLNFSGDQIRAQATEIGTLVTVATRQSVDTGRTTFSLLVPTVNLGASPSVPIQTEGITTVHRFSIIQTFNQGQTELYRVVQLTGTASFVAF